MRLRLPVVTRNVVEVVKVPDESYYARGGRVLGYSDTVARVGGLPPLPLPASTLRDPRRAYAE